MGSSRRITENPLNWKEKVVVGVVTSLRRHRHHHRCRTGNNERERESSRVIKKKVEVERKKWSTSGSSNQSLLEREELCPMLGKESYKARDIRQMW